MKIDVKLPINGYEILIERGILQRAKEELNLNRKVLIVTDDGVPYDYSEILAKQCEDPYIHVIEQGEESKNLDTFAMVEKVLLENGFSRKDCVVALGGGVVGDLAGFGASCFMRGIDFYNIPTTLLSQVDSSVGGKTGVDFMGVKNIIGAFYQPKKVLIDPEVLKTLDHRQFASGLVEAIKMAATFDKELFEKIEHVKDVEEIDIDEVIYKAISIKADVVEKDEKEAGLRKVLNFGHTLGHGIEASLQNTKNPLLHGECVGIGMTAMCDEEVKVRIVNVLKMLNLPYKYNFDFDKAIEAITHDKKLNGKTISTVYVSKIGTFELKDMTHPELASRLTSLLQDEV